MASALSISSSTALPHCPQDTFGTCRATSPAQAAACYGSTATFPRGLKLKSQAAGNVRANGTRPGSLQVCRSAFLAGRSLRFQSQSAAVAAEKVRVSQSKQVRRSGAVCAAAAAAVPAGASEDIQSELGQKLVLGALFGGWYFFNIYFNIYNKQVLAVFPYPITCTLIQFAVGAVLVLLTWMFGITKRPTVTAAQLWAVAPLAVVHTLGNMFTNMSLGAVSVSFTHTIKAMEPFFSVMLSWLVLGAAPSLATVGALLPIVGGVALASCTEASFNWGGFMSAMASNLTFQSRNVLSKKLMVKKEGSMDNIALFSIITIQSFFILLVPTLIADGIKFTPHYLKAANLNINDVVFRAVAAGVCFHAYQQVSYMILQKVSPVTHSVGNCVKRVVIIVTSVLFFRTPVSMLNAVGTSIALAGVFGYSQMKTPKKPEPKSE